MARAWAGWRLSAMLLAGVLALGGAALTSVAAPRAEAPDAALPPPDAAALDALRARYRRPDAIPFPRDNAYSDAKYRLGQVLFFDPRLSGSNTMSCASCHNPALGWEDGLRTARGEQANTLRRSTPTILNIAWAEPLMWDGRKESLEDQALGPVADAGEMNQPVDELVAELSRIPGYRRLFRDAHGADAVTPRGIALALATFQRTIVSNLSPFDRWVAGDASAMGADAVRGFVLFNTRANCAACHAGWRLTDDSFHDIGLASGDIGRGAHMPEVPLMRHAFKTPTLRNIALRGPYMHDGSAMTLREAVLHYDTGFVDRPSLSPEMRRLNLSPRDADDIVAFLRALTSGDDPVPAPALPTEEE
ncbi:MAG: c-type cytochrome [Acetobacteraceae bacterium]|nr:c-type cytochrome [Acetobacteraceae bacterium]